MGGRRQGERVRFGAEIERHVGAERDSGEAEEGCEGEPHRWGYLDWGRAWVVSAVSRLSGEVLAVTKVGG